MDDAFPHGAEQSKHPSKSKRKHSKRCKSPRDDRSDISLPPLSRGSSTHSIQTEPIRVPKKHSKDDSERPNSALNMLYSEGSLNGYSPRSTVNSYMPPSQVGRQANSGGVRYGGVSAWPVTGAAGGNSYERERLLEAVRHELRYMKPS